MTGFGGTALTGPSAAASPCPAGGPRAPGPAGGQENQLGSVCGAVPGGGSEQQHLSHGLWLELEPWRFFPALLSRAELRVTWLEGEELMGHAGGTASLVLEQLLSAFKVQVYFFPPSLSLCFKAAELYLDYFPNLLFTALRTRGLFLQER